jgi:hypothetical protein
VRSAAWLICAASAGDDITAGRSSRTSWIPHQRRLSTSLEKRVVSASRWKEPSKVDQVVRVRELSVAPGVQRRQCNSMDGERSIAIWTNGGLGCLGVARHIIVTWRWVVCSFFMASTESSRFETWSSRLQWQKR